jgi:CP family cyanate transporter-like MFS transporter
MNARRGSGMESGDGVDQHGTMSPMATAICFALLWLCGVALRLTILVVPPIIPLLHADLGLSQTEIGMLSGLPPLLFCLAAIPGSLLVARFGAVPALAFGLMVTGLGSAVRAAASDVSIFFLTTTLMAAGIAVMQPVLPQLVRNWLPRRVGLATAVYISGLLVGEIIAVGLAVPVVLPLADGSWRLSLVIWAVPVVLIALLVWRFAPRSARPIPTATIRSRWPDWSDPLVWRLGFLTGGVNSIYLSTNFFLPDYLTALERPDLISDALVALNACQMPASLLMLAFADRMVRRKWAYVGSAALLFSALAGIILMDAPWVVLWSGLIGFANSIVLVLAFALPSLLSAPHDVHRLSAGAFTISYMTAVLTPIIGGVLWDRTGYAPIAFMPIILWPLVIVAMTAMIDLRSPARTAS